MTALQTLPLLARADFTGRSVLVVGGTAGINLGIASAFVDAGATVCVASRTSEKVDAAVASLSRSGRPAHGRTFDVRDAIAVHQAVESFAGEHGPLDVVISGAAGNFPAAASSLSPNGFKSVVDIDLLGTFNVMRACYGHLRRPGASVVNISAPQAIIPMALQAHVCAAKAGVDMVTRTLAIEWGPEGIRVNSVIPGPIDNTEGMARLAPSDAGRQAVIDGVPLRRMGSAQDIAELCLFLASDAAMYISAAVIPVDGGWSAAGARLDLA